MRDVVLGLLVLALATLCIVQRFQYDKLTRTVDKLANDQVALASDVDALKRPPPVAAPIPPAPTPPPATKKKPDAAEANADTTVLQDAQDQYVHGQYKQAIETAKRVLSSEPSKAWRIIGASQCFLKNRAGAHEAWSNVGPQERAFLGYVCARMHVTLP